MDDNPTRRIADPDRRVAETRRIAEPAPPADPSVCPHTRVVISRKHGCWVKHTMYQGRHQGSRVEVGDSNGTIRVVCFDCGYRRTLTRSEPKPAWIAALLPQLEP